MIQDFAILTTNEEINFIDLDSPLSDRGLKEPLKVGYDNL
jgi:hypothetical protein